MKEPNASSIPAKPGSSPPLSSLQRERGEETDAERDALRAAGHSIAPSGGSPDAEGAVNASQTGNVPFVDTPLLQAKRKAFDNPTNENLDSLIDYAIATTLRLTRNGGDTRRLDYLQELFRNCPHAQITFSDDPDCEEGAIGFMIRVEGCQTSESCGPTLRDAIDKEIMQFGEVKIQRVPLTPSLSPQPQASLPANADQLGEVLRLKREHEKHIEVIKEQFCGTVTGPGAHDMALNAAHKILSLSRENQELREDKERLDWVLREYPYLFIQRFGLVKTPRQGIDAARSAQKEEKPS